MITTTTRTLLASLALSLAAGCGSVPSDTDTEEPAPDAPAQPDVPEQPAPDAPPVIAAGTPDATFGTNGVKTLALPSGYAAALATQGDKLLACATNIAGDHWTVDVTRLTADGEIDTTFGDGGTITQDDYGAGLACRSLAVRPDGSFLVGGRQIGGGGATAKLWDADGKTFQHSYTFSNAVSKPGFAAGPDDIFAYGDATWGALAVSTMRDGGGPLSMADAAISGTFVRAIQSPGAGRVGVGTFTAGGTTGWGVLRQNPALDTELVLATSTISSGVGAADLMNDAIELPDGSFFAVGSAGSGQAVMVARFAAAQATEEHHQAGGPSMAYGVTLDGAQRPIVVGSAQDAGRTVFGWQRYQAASTTLDTSYQGDGMPTLAPPSGGGELVAAARLGDKIYMLGHYDVETATPKLALVRVTE